MAAITICSGFGASENKVKYHQKKKNKREERKEKQQNTYAT